ncbi:MAG: TIGR03936 family radical SAM-associated protein [Oscillospiraceae bacterium]|nr:TIGR03936 family radical SAM-associated protein [Oscillospiraceae bacterium]
MTGQNHVYRIIFKKLGAVKYISHLDLTRVFTRALTRADIDLKHSEGFNPHPKLSFSLPLSVGTESLCERMTIITADCCNMDADEIFRRLSEQLPKGISLVSCSVEDDNPKDDVYAAEYEIKIYSFSSEETEKLKSALAMPELIVDKRTKSGVKPTDIKSQIISAEVFEIGGTTILSAVLSADNSEYLNPEYLLSVAAKAVCRELEPGEFSIKRTKTLTRYK